MTGPARIASLLVVLGLSTMLAACGGPIVPAPSGSPTASGETPSAAPTEAADGGGEPEGDHPSATDATCSSLVPAGSLSALFSMPIAPVASDHTTARISTSINEWWIAQQAGGLACEWQNADASVGSEGLYDFHGVRLLLAPVTAGAWGDFVTTTGGSGNDVTRCGEGLCRRDVHVHDWWLSLWGFEFESEARQTAALAAYDAIIARVTALPAPRSAPTASTLSNDCGVLLPADRLAPALGVPASAIFVEGELRIEFGDLVVSPLRGVRCVIRVNDAEIGLIETLPGGGWAENEVGVFWAASGEETLLPVPGLTEPGALRIQASGIAFDIVTEGDWVKTLIWDTPGTLTLEQTAVAIAGTVVGAR